MITLGNYLSKVDKVMGQVDKITEDIDHMPVAAFIFRDKESDEVHYSPDIRSGKIKFLSGFNKLILFEGTSITLHW